MVQVPAVAGHHSVGGGHRRRGHGGPACHCRRRAGSARGSSRDYGERAVDPSSSFSSVSLYHKLEKSSLEDAEHSLSQVCAFLPITIRTFQSWCVPGAYQILHYLLT